MALSDSRGAEDEDGPEVAAAPSLSDSPEEDGSEVAAAPSQVPSLGVPILGGSGPASYGTLASPFLFASDTPASPPAGEPGSVLKSFKSLELNTIRGFFSNTKFTMIGAAGAFEAEWIRRCCAPSILVFRAGGPGGATFASVTWNHAGSKSFFGRTVVLGSLRFSCLQVSSLRSREGRGFRLQFCIKAYMGNKSEGVVWCLSGTIRHRLCL